MPPLTTIQNSGVGGDSAATALRRTNTCRLPTLYFAVTGKMAGGRTVIRQTISREDALIAHTRKNAYFVFQEDNLGSIQPGKLADLVVLDRDYLTIPADQIKDIKPVQTIVGGRVVYNASRAAISLRTVRRTMTRDTLAARRLLTRGVSILSRRPRQT